MPLLEPLCLGIVLVYALARARREPAVLLRLAALAAAGFLGEASCVRGYDFYRYADPSDGGPWRLWLDVVPLVVVLTWPVVIHSAWELARALSPRRVVALTGAVVLADAGLIEPIAVQAGLWSWSEPGPWGVPIVGVIGWGLLAALAVPFLEASRRAPEGRLAALAALALVPGVCVHLPLLALWWGGLRLLPAPGIGLALAAGLGLSGVALIGASRVDPGRSPGLARVVWLRGPGAGFFFLLLLGRVPYPSLLAWAALAGLPYGVLLWRAHAWERAKPPPPGNDLGPEGA